MNDPDNFLRRWSRRKRESGVQPEKTVGGEAVAPPVRSEAADAPKPGSESAAPPLPEFDLSKLPPIESIGAGTDITAFMQTGVPSALKHAALRRVWSADPAIRDFMGPTENYWDAAGPDGIPGFGDLDPNLDVKRLVSELFGEIPPESTTPDVPDSAVSSAPQADEQPGSDKTAKPEEASMSTEQGLSHRTENGAAQNDSAEPSAKKMARRHGGATPQ